MMLGTEGRRVAQRDEVLGKVFWLDIYYKPKGRESTAFVSATEINLVLIVLT